MAVAASRYRDTLLSRGKENWYCSLPSKGILRMYFSSFLLKSNLALSPTMANSFLVSSILSFKDFSARWPPSGCLLAYCLSSLDREE